MSNRTLKSPSTPPQLPKDKGPSGKKTFWQQLSAAINTIGATIGKGCKYTWKYFRLAVGRLALSISRWWNRHKFKSNLRRIAIAVKAHLDDLERHAKSVAEKENDLGVIQSEINGFLMEMKKLRVDVNQFQDNCKAEMESTKSKVDEAILRNGNIDLVNQARSDEQNVTDFHNKVTNKCEEARRVVEKAIHSFGRFNQDQSDLDSLRVSIGTVGQGLGTLYPEWRKIAVKIGTAEQVEDSIVANDLKIRSSLDQVESVKTELLSKTASSQLVMNQITEIYNECLAAKEITAGYVNLTQVQIDRLPR